MNFTAKGVKTRKFQYRVDETPSEKNLRVNRGYNDIVTVDAKNFSDQFKRDQDEDLAWNEHRLSSARERNVVDSFPQVDIFPSGKVDVNDGRHRLAAAAEKGKRVQVAVKYV